MMAGPLSSGVRLGVDPGAVRVGVAISDPSGVLASPLATLARDPGGGADLADLASIVSARGVVEVVVGLPRSLSGRNGPAEAAGHVLPGGVAERDRRVPRPVADRTTAPGG